MASNSRWAESSLQTFGGRGESFYQRYSHFHHGGNIRVIFRALVGGWFWSPLNRQEKPPKAHYLGPIQESQRGQIQSRVLKQTTTSQKRPFLDKGKVYLLCK